MDEPFVVAGLFMLLAALIAIVGLVFYMTDVD